MTVDGLTLGLIMAGSFWVGWVWRWLNGPKKSELKLLRWDNAAKAAEIAVLRRNLSTDKDGLPHLEEQEERR
ncbi:MAG TPA: hypothetical protein VIT65_23165 [Microlunatus sp.]